MVRAAIRLLARGTAAGAGAPTASACWSCAELDAGRPGLGWRIITARKSGPVLTPLAIDPAHPFPQLLNKSLNLIVRLEMKRDGEVLKHHGRGADPAHPAAHGQAAARRRAAGLRLPGPADRALPGAICSPARRSSATGLSASRATASFTLTRRRAANLLKAVENELHNRRKGDAVRLEIDHECPPSIREALLKNAAPDRGRPLPD